MQRVAVINSFLICTTFANTNIYNSSNGWIPLRLTEQSSRIKNVFKEATDFSTSIFKQSESREQMSKSHPVLISQVKSTPQSNKIFFLQPDTKESSEIFASPEPTVPGVKEIIIEEANNDSIEFSSPERSQPTMNSLFFETSVKGTTNEEANNDLKETSFPETSQPTMNSLFYGTTSTVPAIEGEMVVKIMKKEPDTSLAKQNKTMRETSNANQSQTSEDNKFDNDLHNFYEKVLMTSVDVTKPTEAASIEKFFKGKKNGDVESSTILYIDSTLGYVGNVNEIRKPVVVPISPRNEVNNKMINLLMKYNSKSIPILNNYAVPKTNFNEYNNMFNLYRPQKNSLIAIPFRYNILNHLPVNPLLSVFFSNYGYSLTDSDTDSHVSKKLYGYSNNIHNHGNPFTSEDDSDV